MPKSDPQYQALERVVKADKRFRKFMYLLALACTAFFIIFLIRLSDTAVDRVLKTNQQAATEQKTIAKESIRYMTCVFVIPIEKRTPAIQQKCFEAADLPGGLSRSDFSPVVIPNLDQAQKGASQGGSSSVSVSAATPSSLQGSTTGEGRQPDSSHGSPAPPPDTPPSPTEIFGIPLCVPLTNMCLR